MKDWEHASESSSCKNTALGLGAYSVDGCFEENLQTPATHSHPLFCHSPLRLSQIVLRFKISG